MLKISEAFDCNGMQWGSFFGSPRAVRKLLMLVGIMRAYPEILDNLLFYNMAPNSRFVGMLKNILPQPVQKKMVFAERGKWESILCDPKGLSPASMPLIVTYTDFFRRQSLSADQVLVP